MKFSSNPDKLISTLEKVKNDSNEIIKDFNQRYVEFFDTYLDRFLFHEVFDVYHNDKRKKIMDEKLFWDEMSIIIQEKKNPEYSYIKGLISLLPFTAKYDVPCWIKVELNRRDVEYDENDKEIKFNHIKINRRALKREWREFKEAVKKRDGDLFQRYYHNTYGGNVYNFRTPNNSLKQYTNDLSNNIITIDNFISKIKIAKKVDSEKVELSDDDITALDSIINYYYHLKNSEIIIG